MSNPLGSLSRDSKALPPEKPIEQIELELKVKYQQAEIEKLKERVSELSYVEHLVRDGDAVTDAYLYTSGRRDDEWVFVELYGLTPREVGILCKFPFFLFFFLELPLGWLVKGEVKELTSSFFHLAGEKKGSAIDIINEWSTRVRKNGVEALPEEIRDVFYKYIEILRSYIYSERKGPALMELLPADVKFWEIAKRFP